MGAWRWDAHLEDRDLERIHVSCRVHREAAVSWPLWRVPGGRPGVLAAGQTGLASRRKHAARFRLLRTSFALLQALCRLPKRLAHNLLTNLGDLVMICAHTVRYDVRGTSEPNAARRA